MTVTLDDLAGPADADMFRMTVDWGRWYIDPLPTCDIAEATEDRWPSCSTVKKAADKDWSFLTVNRIAALEPAELTRIAGLDHTQRGDAVRSHEKFAKNVAFGRGTIVHLWAEDLAAGNEPRQITDSWLAANGYPTQARTEALIYQRAMIDFFHTYQPELVAAEYVTIHRTLNGKGYGATPDGLYRIPRLSAGIVAVDWKTRGESSSHAAYPEEAAQIACGAKAEYMIVRVGDHAERRPMPDIVGGYVVSIRPDGARLYPVDIDKAWTHWTHLHQWWAWKLDEKASIGRVLPKKSAPKETTWPSQTSTDSSTSSQEASSSNAARTSSSSKPTMATSTNPSERISSTVTSSGASEGSSTNTSSDASQADWRFEAKRRYDTLNDAQRADYTARKQTIDTTDRDTVYALLDAVDPIQTVSVPMPALEPEFHLVEPPTPPDEGATINQADVDALQRRFKNLPVIAQTWTGTLVAQGKRTHPFRLKEQPSVRRYEIYRAILVLAEWSYGNTGFPELIEPEEINRYIRAIYYHTAAQAYDADANPGELLATLDYAEAADFAKVATDLTKDRYLVTVDEDGTVRLASKRR